MPKAGHHRDCVRVAAYQAPLLESGNRDALDLIRRQIDRCEAESISILCCPEAVLGGLADYASDAAAFAIARDRLEGVLAPLASDAVTTIVGFTELADGRLYNAAAVFSRGSVAGVYRKLYPAINRSVYDAGQDVPVFRIGALTFGIMICNDSNYFEPARLMAAKGAAAIFVPANTGMPPEKGGAELVAQSRSVDIARAVDNSVWIVRADVLGRAGELVAHGASGIVDPNGVVVGTAVIGDDLVIAEFTSSPRSLRRGWDFARNAAVTSEYASYVAETAGVGERV